MARDILVGLDLGSTSFKAVAASFDGEELATAGIATPWDRTDRGTTMSPTSATTAAEKVLRRCLDQLPDSRVVAVGITGMAEAGFLVDAAAVEKVPAYAWFDDRGAAEAEQLAGDFTSDWFSGTTGLPVSVRCSAVKLKHAVLRGTSPRGLRWESLPEWMARTFGGACRAELSLAARTGLLDLHTHDWNLELLNWVGLDRSDMPRTGHAGETWGTGRAGSILEGAVLTVAGHDHVCAAVGSGAQGDSDVLNSLGTGEAVLCSTMPLDTVTTSRAVAAGLTVGIHVVPDRNLLMAGLGTGARLSTVLTLLGVSVSDARERLEASLPASVIPRETDRWATEIVRDGVARSPVPESIDDPAAVWQSAVVAAGVRLDEAIDRLEHFSGQRHRILATGGWYRSIPFRRLRRATVHRHLRIPAVSEATGLGAALMAGVAADVYPSPLTVPEPDLEEL